MSTTKYRVVETKDLENGAPEEDLKEKKSVWAPNEEHLCITRITPFVPIEGRHVLVYGKSRGENVGFPSHCLLGPDYLCSFFTLALIIGLSGLWFVHVIKRHHYGVVLVGVGTGLLLLCSYSATAFSDPGIIKRQTLAELQNQKQPPNTVLCRLCNVYRPYGARHCFDCNACIRDHDHHCPWSGQCIGGNNIQYFNVFIGSLFIHIIYVAMSAIIPGPK